jgi:hypothetical protein
MSNKSISSLEATDCSQPLGMPTFTITRRDDLSLQFHPPVGSLELANALSLKYPMQASLQKQMQCALIDHIYWERQFGSFADPPDDSSPMPPKNPSTSRASFGELGDPGNSVLAWSVTTGRPATAKRRKMTYDEDKRHKVAKVRQNGACGFHRRKKTEVRKSTHKVINAIQWLTSKSAIVSGKPSRVIN